MTSRSWLMIFVLLLDIYVVIDAGSAAQLACQRGCAKAVEDCYPAAGGYVFGTVKAGVGTPPAVLSCNAAFGQCYAACAKLAAP